MYIFLQILLRTMHKYHFELIIEEHKSDSNPLVFSFPLTTFIAVTAYQSARMTEMKRRNNPFAKGVKGANPEAQEFAQGKFYRSTCYFIHAVSLIVHVL